MNKTVRINIPVALVAVSKNVFKCSKIKCLLFSMANSLEASLKQPIALLGYSLKTTEAAVWTVVLFRIHRALRSGSMAGVQKNFVFEMRNNGWAPMHQD